MTQTTVDSHHHFWHPARGDYGWMPADNAVLSRVYSPVDLADALAATGVTKTILIQAAPSVEETEYLLGIADATPHVSKVVGWIDFEDQSQQQHLSRLAQHPKFSGVRPMIQDIADDNWMLRDNIQWAYHTIQELDLTFDCLGFPRHLANFHQLLTRYPNMRTVIDHCMKPQFRDHNEDNFQFWAQGMARLANETNVYCKLSGLVTEADSDWSIEVIKPYTDHLLNTFGPQRIMWGSDWPVARLKCEYEDWYHMSQQLVQHLTPVDKQLIFCETATVFYRL